MSQAPDDVAPPAPEPEGASGTPAGPVPEAPSGTPEAAAPTVTVSGGESLPPAAPEVERTTGAPLADSAPPEAEGSAGPSQVPSDPGTEEAAAVPTITFGFNLGKIAGQGEDSDPIVRDGRELGLVAVFDGMGGAGGTVYETPQGPRTGAYLASRVARDVVERRMLELMDPEWNLDGPSTAEELRRSVRDALVTRLAELKAPPSGLRSKLLRALPTTMALVALQRREPSGDVWAAHVLWSGDSRAYVLEPATGIHQLSIDDIRDRGDAMANLREDSVVSNAMSADTDFVVHHRMVELRAPFLVIAATDGCFGYVRSPMHFERMLLTTLRDSPSTNQWSRALQEQITVVTGDDAAMATLGVGADHDGFRTLFAERVSVLDERWVDPVDALARDVERAEQELDAARRRETDQTGALWAAYKTEYERYLRTTPESAGEAV